MAMLAPETPLSRRLALENRFDGSIPRRHGADTQAMAGSRLGSVVAAVARQRQRLPAAAVASDPALARMSGYLRDAVVGARSVRAGAG